MRWDREPATVPDWKGKKINNGADTEREITNSSSPRERENFRLNRSGWMQMSID